MTTWTQRTHVTYADGAVKDYGPTLRDADRMVELLAQVSILRQAGENNELHTTLDSNYNVTRYTVLRHLQDREIVNTFDRNP